MKFSVAICTWNRADLLARTLASFCRLPNPSTGPWEIILVDNNSTDRTANVVRDFARRLPLQCVHESRQGHSFARNRAIESCSGQVMVWTDDDVEVADNWLQEYATLIDRTPEASFWGGPIRPKFDAPRPVWLVENWATCQGCFAVRELGLAVFELTADRLPYGANFAVRTAVQRQFCFDESLGRKAHSLVGDEELDVMRRLISAGHRGFWVPLAAVEHLIPVERMTLDYVRRYFMGQGYRLWTTGQGGQWTEKSLRREAFVQRSLFRLNYLVAKSPAWLAHWIRAALAEGKHQALVEKAAAPDKMDLQ